ncbi:MAG: tetratricopeptide repeat-containing glycosyltransferase family protein [Alphaproteobacteria bacterium]
MNGVEDLLANALEHHRAGRLAKAGELYGKILRKHPRHAGALYLTGLAKQALGHPDRALQLYEKAAQADPANPLYHHALGLALGAAGRPREAEAVFREALAAAPNEAGLWTALGNLLKAERRFDEAVTAQTKALDLAPGEPEVMSNLGAALGEAGRHDEALECFRAALARAPDHPELHFNLGNALLVTGRRGEAEEELRHAVRLAPDHARAWSSLGVSQREQGKIDRAIASLSEAIRLAPDYADAHFNLGLAMLTKGPSVAGWREYDWRRKIPGFAMRPVDRPRWDGTELDGGTLLVHAEQGLGDTIQFVRYVREAVNSGGRVVVESPPPLVRLLAGADLGVEIVPCAAERPLCDVQIPLMSLPGLLDPELKRAGALVPYLKADLELARHWRHKLGPRGALKVGLCWQGNPSYRVDRDRSIPVDLLARLATVRGVRLVSLQKGQGREQLLGARGVLPIEDLGDGFDRDGSGDGRGAFLDTAAVMACLDLVVTSDTAVAHLAGAMGVEVWMLLCRAPDWRWGREGAASPWYPSMRIFRQDRAGDWESVIARAAGELARRLDSHAHAATGT